MDYRPVNIFSNLKFLLFVSKSVILGKHMAWTLRYIPRIQLQLWQVLRKWKGDQTKATTARGCYLVDPESESIPTKLFTEFAEKIEFELHEAK